MTAEDVKAKIRSIANGSLRGTEKCIMIVNIAQSVHVHGNYSKHARHPRSTDRGRCIQGARPRCSTSWDGVVCDLRGMRTYLHTNTHLPPAETRRWSSHKKANAEIPLAVEWPQIALLLAPRAAGLRTKATQLSSSLVFES